MSCGVGHRCSLHPSLLWLWRRPAATVPTGPLAWEPPYASGAALKDKKTKKKKNYFLCAELAYFLFTENIFSLLLINILVC